MKEITFINGPEYLEVTHFDDGQALFVASDYERTVRVHLTPADVAKLVAFLTTVD